ncbi:MAG TPA: sigma-70 family RNA polymerase sigma factor, partial [Pirellulales bacterium]|nr:sigma-70 family RNA polymerase sigma factor [Pirellulales bacterium]
MYESPETRHSLIARLHEPRDEQAWHEFVAIYQPLIYRLIRCRGLQDADAQELTQDALVAVAGAIERGTPDFQGGSFRGWLSRIARNMMINYLTRRRPGHQGGGGSDFQRLLAEQPTADEEQATHFDLEQKREVFCWAAEQIRDSFQPATWEAFWRTSVEGESIARAAESLGLSIGAVYAARSRIMARLKQTIDD